MLIDHIWPRGVSRERAQLDDWARDLAPSDELRTRFAHRPERSEVFRRAYRLELDTKPERLAQLRRHAATGRVTILHAARDRDYNNAVVLTSFCANPRRDVTRGSCAIAAQRRAYDHQRGVRVGRGVVRGLTGQTGGVFVDRSGVRQPSATSGEHRENKTWSLATVGSADRPARSSAPWQPLTAAAAWEKTGGGRVVEPPSAVPAGTADG